MNERNDSISDPIQPFPRATVSHMFPLEIGEKCS